MHLLIEVFHHFFFGHTKWYIAHVQTGKLKQKMSIRSPKLHKNILITVWLDVWWSIQPRALLLVVYQRQCWPEFDRLLALPCTVAVWYARSLVAVHPSTMMACDDVTDIYGQPANVNGCDDDHETLNGHDLCYGCGLSTDYDAYYHAHQRHHAILYLYTRTNKSKQIHIESNDNELINQMDFTALSLIDDSWIHFMH